MHPEENSPVWIQGKLGAPKQLITSTIKTSNNKYLILTTENDKTTSTFGRDE